MIQSLPLTEPEVGVSGGEKAAADLIMPPEPNWALPGKPDFHGLEARDIEYLDLEGFSRNT